jgi:hypothetical protein
MANIKAVMANIECRMAIILTSYGEYPLAVWRKLFCYGGYCLGGEEGMGK